MCQYKVIRTKGQASPESSLRAAPRGKITGRQKSSPLVPLGLHSLFTCLSAINPAVVFFCHNICISECRAELVRAMPSVANYHANNFCYPLTFGTLLFLVPQKNQ